MTNNFWWSGKLSEPFFGRTASSEIFWKSSSGPGWSSTSQDRDPKSKIGENSIRNHEKTFFPLCLKSFLNRSWTLCGCFCDRKQSINVSFRSIFVTPRAGLVGPRREVSPQIPTKDQSGGENPTRNHEKSKFPTLSTILPKPFLNTLRVFLRPKTI